MIGIYETTKNKQTNKGMEQTQGNKEKETI